MGVDSLLGSLLPSQIRGHSRESGETQGTLTQSRDLRESRFPASLACWVIPPPICLRMKPSEKLVEQTEKALPHVMSENGRGMLHYSKDNPNLQQMPDYTESEAVCPIRSIHSEGNLSAHVTSFPKRHLSQFSPGESLSGRALIWTKGWEQNSNREIIPFADYNFSFTEMSIRALVFRLVRNQNQTFGL